MTSVLFLLTVIDVKIYEFQISIELTPVICTDLVVMVLCSTTDTSMGIKITIADFSLNLLISSIKSTHSPRNLRIWHVFLGYLHCFNYIANSLTQSMQKLSPRSTKDKPMLRPNPYIYFLSQKFGPMYRAFFFTIFIGLCDKFGNSLFWFS